MPDYGFKLGTNNRLHLHDVVSVANGSNDGFFVIWGELESESPDRANKTVVVVYHCAQASHLLGGEGLPDKDWLGQLSDFFGDDAAKPLQGTSSVTWEGDSGTLIWESKQGEGAVRVQISINNIEFLGRTMFEIHIDVGYVDSTEISAEGESSGVQGAEKEGSSKDHADVV